MSNGDFFKFEIDHDMREAAASNNGLLSNHGPLSDSSVAVPPPRRVRHSTTKPMPRDKLRVGPGRMPRQWIIPPDASFRSRWLQVTMVIAMYIIWVIPVRVGFDWPAQGAWFWLEGLIDVFFYADLVLNFFMAYEDSEGTIVTNRRAIAKNYLGTWFALDLLATFPVDYIVRGVQGTLGCSFAGSCGSVVARHADVSILRIFKAARVFRIIWIVKHHRMLRLSTMLGRFIDDMYKIMPAISMVELLLILLYLGHVSGCFFYFFSNPQWRTANERHLFATGHMQSWVLHQFGGEHLTFPAPCTSPPTSSTPYELSNVAKDPRTGQWYTCPPEYALRSCSKCAGPPLRCYSYYGVYYRYVTAMYWAYTTMTTVGYGDISSNTVAEKLWAITVMIFSGFFFSYTISRMSALVSKLDADRQVTEEQLEMVRTFLNDTRLPRDLSRRVLEFSRKQRVKPYDRNQVLSSLPFELRSKVLRHLYAGAIRGVVLLQREADDDVFLTDMCLRLQQYNCPAGAFVYQRGEGGGDIFFLLRGELHVLDVDEETSLYRVPEGGVVGEATVLRQLEGFGRGKRTESVWCGTACELLRVTGDDILDLLQQYPALHTSLKQSFRSRTHRTQLAMKKRAQEAGDTASEASYSCESSCLLNSNDYGRLTMSRLGQVNAQHGPKEVRLIALDDEPATPATPAVKFTGGETAALSEAAAIAEVLQELVAVKVMMAELQRTFVALRPPTAEAACLKTPLTS